MMHFIEPYKFKLFLDNMLFLSIKSNFKTLFKNLEKVTLNRFICEFFLYSSATGRQNIFERYHKMRL